MIKHQANTIDFDTRFEYSDMLYSCKLIERMLAEYHYRLIILDFSRIESAFAGPMLGLISQVMRIRASKTCEFTLNPPRLEKMTRLFLNTNWGHYLDNKQPMSSFKGYRQIPASVYANPMELTAAVENILTTILGATSGFLAREDLAAIEWSLNEITDNVLNHANSPYGGIVQVSTFERTAKRVEFIVADGGVGIPTTLREGHPELVRDTDALDRAIREGVTRNKSTNQGNGLFGSFEVCKTSEGYFSILSATALARFNPKDGLHVMHTNQHYYFKGTLITASINCSRPGILREALKFGGRIHHPIDRIELVYESDDERYVDFDLVKESDSFGSRPAATVVRNKLTNVIQMTGARVVRISFADVPMISSSFADEVFGKLYAQLGPLEFARRVQLIHTNPNVEGLIDRAIRLRLTAGNYA